MYAQYSKDFNEKHHFDIMGGYEWQHFHREGNSYYAGYYPSTTVLVDDKGASLAGKPYSPTGSDWATENFLVSFFGRANYTLLDRYMLTATVRYDGSSRFSKDNRWAIFPSFALGWKIKEEAFLKDVEWLSDMKLRLGYGITGQQNIGSDYPTLASFTQNKDYAYYPIIGNGITYRPSAYNTDLKWEETTTYNVGLDFGMFNGRIDGSIEFYDTDTKDVLYSRSLPATGGQFNAKNPYQMVANIARMHNRGVELTLNTRNIVTKNFTWTSTLTFAYNKEQVKSIDLGSNTSVDDLVSLGLFMGQPKSTIFGLKKIGIWQKGEEADAAVFGLAPGDVKIQSRLEKQSEGVWTLTDEDGTVTEYTAENPYAIGAEDRIIYGQGSPKTTWGFNNTFVWKNFDLNVFITARWGHMINGALLGNFKDGTKNMPAFYNYWTEDNPTNDYPRPYLSRSTDYSDPTSSLSVVDGSYWKVKNITLGYTLPKKLPSKINMSRARVYATVHNPFIFTKSHLLEDVDPETGADDSFPMYKQIVFGVNVSF